MGSKPSNIKLNFDLKCYTNWSDNVTLKLGYKEIVYDRKTKLNIVIFDQIKAHKFNFIEKIKMLRHGIQ